MYLRVSRKLKKHSSTTAHLQDAVARGVFPAVAVVELDDRVAEAGDAPGDVHAVLVFLRGPLRGGEPAR